MLSNINPLERPKYEKMKNNNGKDRAETKHSFFVRSGAFEMYVALTVEFSVSHLRYSRRKRSQF